MATIEISNKKIHDITVIVIAVPAIIFGGWVISTMWNFFIFSRISQYHMEIPVAIGIRTIIGYLAYNSNSDGHDWESESNPILYTIMQSFLPGLVAIGMSAIIHIFVK